MLLLFRYFVCRPLMWEYEATHHSSAPCQHRTNICGCRPGPFGHWPHSRTMQYYIHTHHIIFRLAVFLFCISTPKCEPRNVSVISFSLLHLFLIHSLRKTNKQQQVKTLQQKNRLRQWVHCVRIHITFAASRSILYCAAEWAMMCGVRVVVDRKKAWVIGGMGAHSSKGKITNGRATDTHTHTGQCKHVDCAGRTGPIHWVHRARNEANNKNIQYMNWKRQRKETSDKRARRQWAL